MQTKQSQKEAIFQYMVDGNSITQLEALQKFGCLRLSAVIHALRRELDCEIETKRVQPTGHARYILRQYMV